ncbi:CDAN1-interacting nuclease 1 isoform X2 [Phymastichus coffea]|uniref:CDAN1-interacting nuclease 1 isoform X2 n=1 Tax=Phymastichus coffea TaxID=108790 RepID=UPI00273C4807|nr:CDAN1-interacting nuclease 1 isoform X2 [Phymastichus coffea]
MKIEEYREIIKTIKQYQGLPKDCSKMLITKYNRFHPFTLKSILNQEIQWRTKINHRQVYKNENNNFYQRYFQAFQKGEPPGILLRMACKLKTCPALLANKVLKEYYLSSENVTKNDLQKMMKDTTLISHASLAYEVYLCVLYDNQYGAIANSVSDCTGQEYEIKLEHYLIEHKIPFLNEELLRTKGYDKTPDCKLEIPIAINDFVINWIESKAQFGTPETHKSYVKGQFLSYWNRFGPGLVIYWFGYVDNIVQSKESRFIVMDHFPEKITYMDPYSIISSVK